MHSRKFESLRFHTYPPVTGVSSFDTLPRCGGLFCRRLSCRFQFFHFVLARGLCHRPLPFDKVKTAYELLGPASASDAPVLRTPSVSSFLSSSHVSSVSLSELLPSSVDLYDPSEECEMLLESLPLPKSIRLFLFGEDDDMWGTGEREDSARQREDEGRCDPVISAALKLPSPTAWPSAVSEAHALRILLRESQVKQTPQPSLFSDPYI
uniref:Putative zinc finger in N-recognin n=1 Tax=Toxoplasma gondii TgCATBr9 TaxID=943120 RepID=A0A2T6IVL3_TOXGO|nr:putative zinc finger in N-recognin [Toxoplasma gondii TgCATBr9]